MSLSDEIYEYARKICRDTTEAEHSATIPCERCVKTAINTKCGAAIERERDCGDGNVCGTVGEQCQKCLRAMFHREVARSEKAESKLTKRREMDQFIEGVGNFVKAATEPPVVPDKKCPTCQSPQPHLHPAMQHEGEVQPCRDAFHLTVTPQNTIEKIEKIAKITGLTK